MVHQSTSYVIHRSFGLGPHAGVGDLDKTGSGLTDINLAVEGSSGRFDVRSDGESPVAVALNGINESLMIDNDVSDVLTGGVDDVEVGSEILADGGGNNSEVKGEVVGTFSVDNDVLEAELADFDFAGSGGSSRVNLVDGLFGIVSGVIVREHDLAGAHLVLIGRDNSSEVETFVSESGLNIVSGELNGEGNFVVSLDGDDGG
jgi:hypothetical protein